ncbi:hypothetical protein BOX15_Mlig022717g1 [Macrostomum lignano]|uniref:Hexosyltransferase n=1 Tax=Macrostomum lignano TaxID=282301 RepID=A0A267EEX7_9PLAT|nr:hypothetical protein BOX15_Mlig022717g1 [Macrostomum lignano]
MVRLKLAISRLFHNLFRGRRQTLCLTILAVIAFVPILWFGLEVVPYMLVLPYSQFTYPLEIDFQQLLSHYDRFQAYPRETATINNVSFAVLHPGKNLCQLHRSFLAQQAAPRLLILVKSGLGNRQFRDAVRSTWVNQRNYQRLGVQVFHAFVLGGSVSQTQQVRVNAEQAMHGDIIQQDFIDSYFNNTYKTMFAFDFAANSCQSADFVLFADDDYYVSPTNLAHLLRSLLHRRSDPRLAVGFVFAKPVPKRSPMNRWYTTLSEYPYAFWPPYPTGGAVLTTRALCRRVSLAQRFVRYIRFDDVFLGIVLKKIGIEPEHHGLFYHELLTPVSQQVYGNVIAMHLDRRLNLLHDIWRAMNYSVFDVPVISLATRSLL